MGLGTGAQTLRPADECEVTEGQALTQQWQCPGSGTPRCTWAMNAGPGDSALGAQSQPSEL